MSLCTAAFIFNVINVSQFSCKNATSAELGCVVQLLDVRITKEFVQQKPEKLEH